MKMTSFYCDICKKYFPRKKQLIDHATLIHPGVPILSTKLNDDELDQPQAVLDPQSLTQIAGEYSLSRAMVSIVHTVLGHVDKIR